MNIVNNPNIVFQDIGSLNNPIWHNRNDLQLRTMAFVVIFMHTVNCSTVHQIRVTGNRQITNERCIVIDTVHCLASHTTKDRLSITLINVSLVEIGFIIDVNFGCCSFARYLSTLVLNQRQKLVFDLYASKRSRFAFSHAKRKKQIRRKRYYLARRNQQSILQRTIVLWNTKSQRNSHLRGFSGSLARSIN